MVYFIPLVPFKSGSLRFSKIKMNFVLAEVPLLLGLDVLVNEKLLANNVRNEVHAKHHGC